MNNIIELDANEISNIGGGFGQFAVFGMLIGGFMKTKLSNHLIYVSAFFLGHCFDNSVKIVQPNIYGAILATNPYKASWGALFGLAAGLTLDATSWLCGKAYNAVFGRNEKV